MSDEFTTNENGSKTPEETNFQDYTAPENEIVQNETSQMTQEQPETSYGATSAEENPQPDNTAYAYGQTAYQQAYQSEQSQPNAYQQAYYGQTQAKGTGTGFGIASTRAYPSDRRPRPSSATTSSCTWTWAWASRTGVPMG